MEEKTNYTLIGMTVLALTAGLLIAIVWLSIGLHQKKYHTYTVYLHEAASGLNKDAAVRFNGVQVGFVKEIKLYKNDPRQVEISLNIEDGTPITTSTAATLISQGITGVTYIGLSAGASDLKPLEKMPGEPYPVIPARPSLFNQLDSLLKEVSQSIDNVTIEAQHIFNEENARYIQGILKNVETLSAVFANNSKNIDGFLVNIAKASNNIPQIINELQTGISKFKTMADSLSKAGLSVSNTMGTGKTTLDKMSLETLAPATMLLRRLNSIAANFEKISSEMRQNPSVIVRGSAAPKAGPGE